MAIYSIQRAAEGFLTSYRVCDARGVSVGSCDQFLTELNQRDCSVYTQRAYAIGLAHFFNWLHHAGGDPDHVTRQTFGSYIAEFARADRQGAVTSGHTHKGRQPRTINHRISVLSSYFDTASGATREMAKDRGTAASTRLPGTRLLICRVTA